MIYNELDKEIQNAMQVAESQFESFGKNIAINFIYKGTTINDPFMDETGRFALTLEQAYTKYGEENINQFVFQCNEKYIEDNIVSAYQSEERCQMDGFQHISGNIFAMRSSVGKVVYAEVVGFW